MNQTRANAALQLLVAALLGILIATLTTRLEQGWHLRPWTQGGPFWVDYPRAGGGNHTERAWLPGIVLEASPWSDAIKVDG